MTYIIWFFRLLGFIETADKLLKRYEEKKQQKAVIDAYEESSRAEHNVLSVPKSDLDHELRDFTSNP